MLRVVLAAVFLVAPSVAVADITGKPCVIDGDTIEIAGQRIRLHGIDAPGANQTCRDENGKEWRCGQEATVALITIVGDHSITCKGDERGKYGRLIAVCYVGLFQLNVLMVTRGWTLAYRLYSSDYVSEEDDARVHNRELWRGQFIAPWEWRRTRGR